MESVDRELIQVVIKNDVQLRRLYDEHQCLESRLLKFSSKIFLTPDEQMEERRLKKQKLFGVDRMMEIISMHRSTL